MNTMKMLPLAMIAALLFSVPVGAEEPQSPSPEQVEERVDDLSIQIKEAKEQLNRLEERIRDIEDRLGDSFGRPSPFNTVERRLEELERDVRGLKR
jgi:polyhydroxyalkanoate synthesis regulator phasin